MSRDSQIDIEIRVAQQQARRELQRLRTDLKNLTKQFKGLRTGNLSLKNVLGGLAGATVAGGLAKTGFAFNMLKENALLSFKTLLGDGGKATQLLEQLEEFAKRTPFGFEDLVDASQRMLAFGFNAEQLIPVLTNVGDAAAAMGGSPEVIERVVRALGQMKARGKLAAQEMLQLTEAGIPAWEILREGILKSDPAFRAFADRLRQNVQRLKEQGRLAADTDLDKLVNQNLVQRLQKMAEMGKLGAEQVVAILQEGLGRRFGGLMAEQAETMSGRLAALGDTFRGLMGDLLGGPFDFASQGVDKLTGALDGFRGIAKGLPGPLRDVLGMVTLVAGLAAGDAAGGVGALGGALSGLGGLAKVVMNPQVLGIVALIAAVGILVANFDKLREAIEGLFSGTKKVLIEAAAGGDPKVWRFIEQILKSTSPSGWAVVLGASVGWTQGGALGEWLRNRVSVLPTFPISVLGAASWIAGGPIGEWLRQGASTVGRTVVAAAQWGAQAASGLGPWLHQGASTVGRTVVAATTWGAQAAAGLGQWLLQGAQTVGRTVVAATQWGAQAAAGLGLWLYQGATTVGRTILAAVQWGAQAAMGLGLWLFQGATTVGRTVVAAVQWGAQGAVGLGQWLLQGAQTGATAIQKNVTSAVAWGTQAAAGLGAWLLKGAETGAGAIQKNISTAISFGSKLVETVVGWLSPAGDKQRDLSVGLKLFLYGEAAVKKVFEFLSNLAAGFTNGANEITVTLKGSLPGMGGGASSGGSFADGLRDFFAKIAGILAGAVGARGGKVGSEVAKVSAEEAFKRLWNAVFPGGPAPNFPQLAAGGIATGPTLAMIGEGDEAEAVIPLSKLGSLIGGGRGRTRQPIQLVLDRHVLADVIVELNERNDRLWRNG